MSQKVSATKYLDIGLIKNKYLKFLFPCEHIHIVNFIEERKDLFFKILKNDKENNLVFLGYAPNIENPFGKDPKWFKADNIPKELLVEFSVIKIIKNPDGKISVIEGPIF
ncbi:MAG: hypothetical protein QG630_371 [Patescibacteria group bacterium]|nr:hypothetical protein [Patescibacteria group bacterium]